LSTLKPLSPDPLARRVQEPFGRFLPTQRRRAGSACEQAGRGSPLNPSRSS